MINKLSATGTSRVYDVNAALVGWGDAPSEGPISSCRDLTCSKKGSQVFENVLVEPRRKCFIFSNFMM